MINRKIITVIGILGLLQFTYVSADKLDNSKISTKVKNEAIFESDLAKSISSQLEAEHLAVTPTNIKSDKLPTKNKSVNNTNNDAIGEILIQAVSLMGISYKWGGNTPETGMDCSGFIRYVFQKSMGITLPRTAAGMSRVGKRVSINDMQPGDLILFNTIGGRRNTHIGMYIGNNQFIQSPRTGERIQITPYNSYWRAHTNGIKRIIQEVGSDSGKVEHIQTYQNIEDQALPTGYVPGAFKHKARHQRYKHSRRYTYTRKHHNKNSPRYKEKHYATPTHLNHKRVVATKNKAKLKHQVKRTRIVKSRKAKQARTVHDTRHKVKPHRA
jgi:cell wall-associated NlpC family hydrolase